MLSFLKRIFTGSPTGKRFQFLIVDRGEQIETHRWYRLSHWEFPHFLRMESEWSSDWKCLYSEEMVVGVSKEDRESTFLILGDQPDFQLFLQRKGKEKEKGISPIIDKLDCP